MEKDPYIHFHDGENQEDVIHFHKERLTIKDFFDSLNFTLSAENCGRYVMLTKGQLVGIPLETYIPQDLDKILISCYHQDPNYQELERQWQSIGNFSLIQSELIK